MSTRLYLFNLGMNIMEWIIPYLTPVLVLAVGVFVGRVNTSIKYLREDFNKFKTQCFLTHCKREN
jgi:NhaP-type Na+/H+ or K+/H+ antiporter